MSALKYKSNIAVPGVEFGNNVIVQSPSTKRLAINKPSTTENEQLNNDFMVFGHLVGATISWNNQTTTTVASKEVINWTKTYNNGTVVQNTIQFAIEEGSVGSCSVQYNGTDITSQLEVTYGNPTTLNPTASITNWDEMLLNPSYFILTVTYTV